MKINLSKLDLINKWLLVLMGFVIPLSTAATNVVLGLVLLFWVFDNISDRFKRWVSVLKTNPVALMGLIFFLIYVAGMLYTRGEKERVYESLVDGARFLFISLAMIYVKDKQDYSRLLFSFSLAMGLTLLCSCLLWMDRLPGFIPVKGNLLDCNVFLNHIAQNLFMAYMAFLAAVRARAANGYGQKLLWGIFSLLALANILFMVGGMTGHLVSGILFLYFFISWDRRKSLVAAGSVLLILAVFAWMNPSNSIFLRSQRMIEEIKAWEYGKKASSQSSSGLRLEFYTNTVKLIKENPVFGTGTGSFENAYLSFAKNAGMNPTDNPHNDYLMTTAHFGFVGLAVLLGFFLVQWRSAGFFQDKTKTFMARGFVLTIFFAALVSSPLQDHAEGWFFALMSACLFSGSGAGPVFWGKREVLPQ
nr:O-antigen ligase family protein [Desulfobacula sp.]